MKMTKEQEHAWLTQLKELGLFRVKQPFCFQVIKGHYLRRSSSALFEEQLQDRHEKV